MRYLVIVPLCLAAACSGGGEEKKAEETAATMQAGQWVEAPVQAATVQKLEEIILTKARDLRRAAVG